MLPSIIGAIQADAFTGPDSVIRQTACGTAWINASLAVTGAITASSGGLWGGALAAAGLLMAFYDVSTNCGYVYPYAPHYPIRIG